MEYPTSHNMTPLMLAAVRGSVELCQLLLLNGANIYASEKHKNDHALHHAAREGKYNTAAFLLKHGAQMYNSINFWVDVKSSPITPVIIWGHPHIMDLFLNHCNKLNLKLPLRRFFNIAVKSQSEICAVTILQHGYFPKQIEIPRQRWVRGFTSCFQMAAYFELGKVLSMLCELNMQFLQEEWLISKKFPGKLKSNENLVSWLVEYRKQPARLVKLCKSTILAQHGSYYIPQITQLPLPKTLKTFLKVVESPYGHK